MDIAIVGAGVIGAATAWWLKREAPRHSVALIDQGQVASGASGRNAGFLLQGTSKTFVRECRDQGRSRAEALWNFTGENLELIRRELDPKAVDLETRGSHLWAGSERERTDLEEEYSALRDAGLEVEWSEPPEMEASFHGGLFFPHNAALHSVRFVDHLVEASGAQLYPNEAVVGFESDGGRVQLDTECGTLLAERVLFALGAHIAELIPETKAWIHPKRAQMLVTYPSSQKILDSPLYSHDGFYYLRQLADGRILLGGARDRFLDTEIGFEDSTPARLTTDLDNYFEHWFKRKLPPVHFSWSGTMAFTTDLLPIVAQAGSQPIWWLSGLSGHGMGYGFRMGRLAAEILLDRKPHEASLFSMDRLTRPKPKGSP